MRRLRLSPVLRKEKHGRHLIACAFLLFGLSHAALAQSGRHPVKKEPAPPPSPASNEAKPETEGEKQKSDEDKVYSSRQVDVKAKITSGKDERPSHRRGCPDNGRVTIKAVLHKSGKVTNVSIVKGLNCSYDKDAMEIVRRYKFTPAMKDGQPVSQGILVDFEFRRVL
jgi:TonB family protein